MKLYRVDYRHECNTSFGFTYHGSRKEARKVLREAVKKGTADPVEYGGSDIEQIIVQPTKRGILAALNKYAGHPDNG